MRLLRLLARLMGFSNPRDEQTTCRCGGEVVRLQYGPYKAQFYQCTTCRAAWSEDGVPLAPAHSVTNKQRKK